MADQDGEQRHIRVVRALPNDRQKVSDAISVVSEASDDAQVRGLVVVTVMDDGGIQVHRFGTVMNSDEAFIAGSMIREL